MFRNAAKKIKNQFITGLIIILPLGLTTWIVWIIFSFIGNRFIPLFRTYPTTALLPLPAQMLISAFLTIVFIWFIGVCARNFIGRMIMKWTEKLLLKTPVISKIYRTIRRITDTMFVNKQAFKKVAIIEYPREGVMTMVFVTNETVTPRGEDLVTVFVPSTPNPTTGYCIVLPREDVQEVPLTVNQAMEFILSGGILVPEDMRFPTLRTEKIPRKE